VRDAERGEAGAKRAAAGVVGLAHLLHAVLRAGERGQRRVLADGGGGDGEGVVDLGQRRDQLGGPAK
jgi:hypothetical protein